MSLSLHSGSSIRGAVPAESPHAFFNELANRYETLTDPAVFAQRQQVFERVAESAFRRSDSPQPTCLDLGCGPGSLSTAFARIGFTVHAVDAAPAMIEIAQQRLTDEPEEVRRRCTFHHADVGGFLRGPDLQADLVVCSSLFEYLDDPIGILELIVSRMRPTAVLAVSLPNQRSLWRRLEPLLERRKDARATYRRYWLNVLHTSELIRAAQGLGLEPVLVRHFGIVQNFGVRGRRLRALLRLSGSPLLGTLTLVVLGRRSP